jgi:zinc protease
MGLRRSNPDYIPLRIGTLILGGAFASRLNQKVRDDLGLTYSINANLEAMDQSGIFEISTFTRNEKVLEVLQETQKVVAETIENGVTQKELDAAKALMIGQFPAAVETPERLAMNLLILRRYGVPDTYLSRFIENIREVKLSQVNQALKQNLSLKKMNTVIFADQKLVLEKIKSFATWQIENVAK